MNAAFPLPMRYMQKWAWENIWTAFSVIALVAVPWLLAFVTVPNLGSVYGQAGASALVLAAVFGFLWGIAQVLFGLSIKLVGMSLTFAVVNGLSSAIGSWIPLVVQHPREIFSPGGLTVSAGVMGVVGGVAICSWAGHLRSKQQAEPAGGNPAAEQKSSFGRRLAVTIASGILAPCLNLGFAFGQKISTAATHAGASPAASTNAALALVLTAGFVSNIAYCIYLLSRNRTVPLFNIPETKKYLPLATLMGTLWIFSFALYGSSTSYLGAYGTVVGWPVLMANITIISSILDIAYGDWTKKPLRIMVLGVTVLIGAVGVMSYGMYRLQPGS
jgi:L-rhamnose-H+ transport protein